MNCNKPGEKMNESASDYNIIGEEHWTHKDEVRLFLWEKYVDNPDHKCGTVLFVHGSSMASQPTFDLQVEGRPFSSAMDWFAARGFDTWCVDMEGYGRSDKHRDITCDIANGAADLAEHEMIAQCVRGDLLTGSQDAERDGQVEMAAFLGKIRRSQIDGDAFGRQRQTDRRQCRADALAAFGHRLVRQTDDGKARQPVGEVDFDRDQRGVHPHLGAAVEYRQRHGVPSLVVRAEAGPAVASLPVTAGSGRRVACLLTRLTAFQVR